MLGAKQVSVPNHLLGALPRKDYQKLLPVLEPVTLAFGQVLYESHAQIRHVYFPIDCFVSMLTTVDGGRAAEVGLIGSDQLRQSGSMVRVRHASVEPAPDSLRIDPQMCGDVVLAKPRPQHGLS